MGVTPAMSARKAIINGERMPLHLHLLTPDAQYPDDGDIERQTAGPDVDWTICRERDVERIPVDALAQADGVVSWHEMRIDAEFIAKMPGDRPRRRRLRSHRPGGGGPRRHPGVQYARLWHKRGRRPRDRVDACADSRHR